MVTRRVKTGGAYVGAGGLGAPSPPQWQNTYEDQEFTGAYVTDPGGGPDQWQYGTGGGVPLAPMVFFDNDYLWGDPDTDSPWADPGNTYGCTLVAEFRTPALPVSANWCLGGVGAYGGAQHNRIHMFLKPDGSIYVYTLTRDPGGAYPLSATTPAGSIQVDTRYTVHVNVDTTRDGEMLKIWINGTEAATGDQPGVYAAEYDWGSTAATDASRRGSVGIQTNAYGTGGTLVTASRIGYIDGGSGDVPVEMGLFFFSTAQITDPSAFYGAGGLDLSSYAATAQMIFGHTPTYDAAAWAAGRNDGTGPDLDMV